MGLYAFPCARASKLNNKNIYRQRQGAVKINLTLQLTPTSDILYHCSDCYLILLSASSLPKRFQNQVIMIYDPGNSLTSSTLSLSLPWVNGWCWSAIPIPSRRRCFQFARRSRPNIGGQLTPWIKQQLLVTKARHCLPALIDNEWYHNRNVVFALCISVPLPLYQNEYILWCDASFMERIPIIDFDINGTQEV